MVQYPDTEAAITGLPHGGDPTVFASNNLDSTIEKADISVFRTGSLDPSETEFGKIVNGLLDKIRPNHRADETSPGTN